MLNDRESDSHARDRQPCLHSTFNTEHSTFAFRAMPRRQVAIAKQPSGVASKQEATCIQERTLNEQETRSPRFHSTFNTEHSTFNIRLPSDAAEAGGDHETAEQAAAGTKPLAFGIDLPHTTSRTFRATISVRHPRRAFQRTVFSALIVGFPASLEGRANYIKGRCLYEFA
jgi:hypothetical protein